MNGIEKLRGIDKMGYTFARGESATKSNALKDITDQIEREHNEELAEKTATICRKNDEIAQLRADLAAAKRDMTEAAERADMAAATLNDVSEMVFGEVRGPEHAGELLVELGKRLMPQGMEWLRYDDGEKVLPSDEGIIGIEYSQTGNTVLVTTSDDEPRVVFAPGERVKRPEPEVRGADELPIKVGETVYSLQGEGPLIVSGYDGEFLKIESGGLLRADYATHTPPETQERIDEDKRKRSYNYWGCFGTFCSNCPAVIDGEKPYVHYGVASCGIAQGMDIARRKQELDARTMGGE